VDGVGALETAPTSSSYEDDIRDVEQLARRLRPLWRDRAAKLDVAQKLRRFLHDHRGDRLGEALAVMAWRSKHRVSPDGDIPTESTLCRRVLDIGSSRANSLAHALVALDHAKVPVKHTKRVLKKLGGIEATTKLTEKGVRKAWKRIEKKLGPDKRSSGGRAKKTKKPRLTWTDKGKGPDR
jgi:hypothetical protein